MDANEAPEEHPNEDRNMAAIATVSAELINLIKARNAETRAWLAEGPQRWATLFVEDPAWWAERGILTVDEFERDNLIGNYVDFYKELHGIKPRWINFDACTLRGLQEMMDDLHREVEQAQIFEEEGQRLEQEALDATPLTHNPFASLAL